LDTPSIRRHLGALYERPFRLLWAGQLVSAVGDALVPVAVAFAVLDLTGSAADLGLVLAAMMASRVVFIVAGGVWSDRLPRQLVMIAADIVRAGAHGVIALAFFTDAIEVWHLIVSSALFGAASAFFGPASTGLVKSIVSTERLQEANALIGISQNAASIFGPALAGLLVSVAGFGVVFAIDAASFVVSAAFLVAMRLPAAVEHAGTRSFLMDVAQGFGVVRRRTWLWASFISFAVGNVSIAAFFVLGPLVVEAELGGPSTWGLVLAAGAGGGVLGSLVALRWKPARPLVPAAVLMLTVSLQLVGLVPPVPVPVLMAAVAAAFASIAIGNALWDTMLQQHVPQETISRVSSLDWMVSLVFMPLGYTAAGPLADRIGVEETLLLAAALGTVASLSLLLVPSIRNLRRLDETAPDEGAAEDVSSARTPLPV
jgi:MFS family permease